MISAKHYGAENPYLWPNQTEVDLGNGVYGYRRYIEFGTAIAANKKSQFNLGVKRNQFVSFGGWWDMGDGLKTILGCNTVSTTLSSGATGGVRLCFEASSTMVYHVSSLSRPAGTKMEIWVKYTK